MAKRSRYPGRPGSTRPGRPSAKAARPASRPGGLTEAELARAAELESEISAREKAAAAEQARRQQRGRLVEPRIAPDAGVPLSVRAANEYAYVARDVRHIAITGTIMFVLLGVIWAVVNASGLNPV